MKKNNILLGIFPALSGGLTGIIMAFAGQQLNDTPLSLLSIKFLPMLLCSVLTSVVFTIAWFYISLIFSETFKAEPGKEFKINAIIFSAGIPASLIMPVIIRYYNSLANYSLKVVGSIYIPFKHYMHVNFAGYCFFILFGAVIVFIAFVTALRFCYKMYLTGLPSNENARIMSIFMVFFIFFGVATSYVTLVYPPTGDEPHYLLIAKSISQDFDLDLTNNYADTKSISEYYPTVLDWQNMHNTAGKGGKGIYSIHSPGLPALISLIFRFTGRYGVQLFMDALTALFIALLYLLLMEYGFAEKISISCACIIGFTIPVAADSSLVLTEIPAVLLITGAMLLLARRRSIKHMWVFFVMIGILPFFHTKLSLVSVTLYIYYYWLAYKEKTFRLKKEAVNNIPVIFFGSLMLYYYYGIYGKFAFTAVTSTYLSSTVYFIFTLPYAITSFFGILFDRDFGLISYNWFMVVPLYGLAAAAIKRETKVLIPAALFMPYVLMFFFMNNWGGSMTPARQLIPSIPALAVAAAYFMQNTAIMKDRFFKAAVFVSVLISFILMVMPFFRYASGKEKIYSVISAKIPALMWIFPTFSAIITPFYFVLAAYSLIIIALFFRYKSVKNP